MESNLSTGFSYKNEVKSIMSLQLGSTYGFILEIESSLGKFYCPLQGYRTKEQAFQILRGRLK